MEPIGIPLIRRGQFLSEVLRSSSKKLMYDAGKQVHGAVLRVGYALDLMMNNDLIDMYAKWGRMDCARSVFDIMPERNVVSWAYLMSGYLRLGDAKASLLLFNEMGHSNVNHNEYTLSMNIKACGVLGALETGKQIQAVCCKTGLGLYPVVGNSIIDMYFKFRRIDEAEQVFDEMPVRGLVTWNSIIAGYANFEDKGKKSLHFLQEMQEHGEMPDDFTFSSSLKACRGLGAIREGKQIHGFLIRKGYSISAHTVLAGALVDLYAQSGFLFEAREIFREMEGKTMISWAALILGYARKGDLSAAMDLFRQLRSNICLESVVLSSIISLFANSANVELGKQMHSYAIKVPSNLDCSVANSILDMYLKCSLTEEANKHFDKMAVKNVFSYAIMIRGYGANGLGKEAVQLFKKMQAEKIEPDLVTYLAVLSACSRSVLVEESQECFTRLCNEQELKPRVEHYSCVVDVLGRAGRLKEAKELIEKMPLKPNVAIWQTLFNACRTHRNVEMGREVGEILLKMGGDSLLNYALVSNIYVGAGLWKERNKLQKTAKARGLVKAG
ncbi:hypothetical protein ACS0TY_012361 [Phlomoides rotata]